MTSSNKRILPDLSTLQASIDALKAENEALKAKANKDTRVTIEDYKGTPVLYFEGNFKPFRKGISGLRAIMDMEPSVKKFIKSAGKSID